MSDTRSYTYAELATALGIGIPSVRNLVRRKRWQRVTGNDKLARIVVPVEYVEWHRSTQSAQATVPPVAFTGDGAHSARADGAHSAGQDTRADGAQDTASETALAVLIRHIEKLEAEIEPLRAVGAQVAALRAALDAANAERDRWQEHAKAAWARAATGPVIPVRRGFWPFRRAG